MYKRILRNFLFHLKRIFEGKPEIFISFGISPGDDLLCTIIAKQLYEKGYKCIWMGTCYPELYVNNPHVSRIILQDSNGNITTFNRRFLRYIGTSFIHPWYTYRNEITDQDVIPEKHIIHLMCDQAGVHYPSELKPILILKDSEIKRGKIFESQICVQSMGRGARQHMKNKDWFPERFSEVVQYLNKEYKVIQIGSKEDDLLPGVYDLRGKTTIREVASILSNSRFFLGQVGFLMHLARAVECKSVIVYGGREKPEQSGYQENINLYSDISCSPCWYWNTCTNAKICMDMISVSDVLAAVKKVAEDTEMSHSGSDKISQIQRRVNK